MINAVEVRGARMARIWIKIAVVYLLIGVIFGLVMGMSHQFQYVPVHTHINLLGWATLGLAGVIYWLCPRAGGHWLGLVHFWPHNIGLSVFLVGLFCLQAGHPGAQPVVAIGATIAVIGIVFFTINVFVNLKKPENTGWPGSPDYPVCVILMSHVVSTPNLRRLAECHYHPRSIPSCVTGF